MFTLFWRRFAPSVRGYPLRRLTVWDRCNRRLYYEARDRIPGQAEYLPLIASGGARA